MKIIISKTANQPLYQQIMEQMKEAVFSGELEDGEMLPSIRNFAKDLRVSVLTIRRVYDELEKEGFLIRQVGIGTFVTTKNLQTLKDTKKKKIEHKMTVLLKEAKMLKITKKELHEMIDLFYEEA